MKNNSFFSIIIPVFRAKDYIARCIESCINQTFQELEIILIDDCGEDETIEIAKEYAKKDQRIIILHNSQNLGAFLSRNKGIKYAKGEYCLFVDCDDFIAPKTLEIVYHNILKYHSDIIHFRFEYFPKSLLRKSPSLKEQTLQNPKICQTLNTNTTFQSICDKAFKTNMAKIVAHKLSFIQPPFSSMEDGLFFLVASFEMQSYIAISEKLYFYQNNPQSTTKLVNSTAFKKKIKDFKNGLNIIQKVKLIYPQYLQIIQRYEAKVVSAYILEGRRYESKEVQKLLDLLSEFHHDKKSPSFLHVYLQSTLLSIQYFYRWQTLARITLYLCSFGKIKL